MIWQVISIEYNLIPEGYEALQALLILNTFKIVKKLSKEVFAVHKNYLHDYSIDEFTRKNKY